MQTISKDPGEELIHIVTEDNEKLGRVTRNIMREQNLIHRASYILVFNSQKELLIQKRTQTKDIYPGYWDVAAGGVVLAEESYEESARRELREELGITAELDFCFDHYYEDADNRVWGRIFCCSHDGPFRLQDEEIVATRFLPIEKVLERSQTGDFTPDGILILKQFAESAKTVPPNS